MLLQEPRRDTRGSQFSPVPPGTLYGGRPSICSCQFALNRPTKAAGSSLSLPFSAVSVFELGFSLNVNREVILQLHSSKVGFSN